MPRIGTDLALVAALAAVFLVAFRELPSHQAYFYDEADYIIAGSRGLTANFLERPSMPVVAFFQTGLNRDMQARRASLSDIVRGSKDITFFRHYHGPVYFYWLAALGPLVNFDEYLMRSSGLVFHLATFAAIYFGVLILSSTRSAALIAGCLFLFGQSNIGTDIQITPHIPYVFFTVLSLLLFALYLKTARASGWYASIAALAAAFCSIDYAILLPIAYACCAVLFPDRRPSTRMLLRSLLLFAGCLLVLWPVGLLRLSAIKGYFYIAYLAMQRKGSYGVDTPLSVWLSRLSGSPMEYSIFAAGLAIVAYGFFRKRSPRYLTPFFFYAGLMLLTTLKNTSLNPTYVSSILPCLAVISGVGIGLVLHRRRPIVRRTAVSLALLAITAGGYQLVMRAKSAPMLRPEEGIMTFIRLSRMQTSNILVPYEYLPAMSYYFPQMQLHAYLKTDDPEALAVKLRRYQSRALVVRESDRQSAALNLGFHVRPEPIPQSAGYSLVHIDGTI